MSISAAKDFYNRALHSQFGDPQGASRAEIASVEAELGVNFPAAYVQFLEWVGRDFHGIFRGTQLFVTDIVDNTKFLGEFIEDNDILWSPQGTAVVPYSHQGYAIVWFDLPIQDSSKLPCFYYTEEWEHSTPERLDFWELILDDLRMLESASRL